MIAIWIAIFVIIQALFLIFAITLCKSAALADREFERARSREARNQSHGSERAGSKVDSHLSPDTKPATRLGYSRSDS